MVCFSGNIIEIAEATEEIDEDGVKAINFLMENNFVKDIFEAIESYIMKMM